MRTMPGDTFLPRRLLPKLRAAAAYGATFIAAPSGYGKTYAVQQLQRLVEPEGDFFWCPAVWEDQFNGWRGFCEQVARFDPESASALAESDVFGSGAGRAADLLRNLTCPIAGATYLVVDDFHLMLEVLPADIITALINHTCERLHIILMGHGFRLPFFERYGAFSLNWIGAEDLLFDRADVQALFAAGGVVLNEQTAEHILLETGGWAAALQDSLADARQGKDRDGMPVGALIARLAFNRLPAESRLQLLCLAFLEEASEDDLCELWQLEQLQEEHFALLAAVPLLREDEGARRFTLLPALRTFLRERLKSAPQAIRREVHARAGRLFGKKGELVQAIECYYQVGDYDGLLQLDLKVLGYTRIGDTSFEDIAREVVSGCPMDIKRAHPIALLRIAYHLFAAGDRAAYELALAQAEIIINKADTPVLYGEWLLVSMLRHLPDVHRMHSVLLEAEAFLQGPPQSIPPGEPFLFGCPSIWFALYHTPGRGAHIADGFTQLMRTYRRVFGGRGFGADQLFRGEMASMQMRLSEAENYAHMAAALGEQANEPTVVYGAALLLARIAIARKDLDGALKALSYLEEVAVTFPSLQGTAMTKYMLASVHGLILSMMQEIGMALEVADSTARLPRGNSLLAQMTLHVRVVDLMLRGEVARGLGEMEAVLSQDDLHCNNFTRMTLNTAVAVCMALVGRPNEALEALTKALEAAHEDGLMAMFFNHREALRPLFSHPSLAKYKAFIHAILTCEVEGAAPSASDRTLHHQTDLPGTLTEREREVAQLAAKGLRNAEIAKRLFISENTVKKHMQTIFEKLDIDRRSRLVEHLRPH